MSYTTVKILIVSTGIAQEHVIYHGMETMYPTIQIRDLVTDTLIFADSRPVDSNHTRILLGAPQALRVIFRGD